MEHSFDVKIATEYGMECAVIIKHLYFWIKKNQVCEKNFHDGRYWTYGSVKAFCELFPYMGDKKLRNAFKKLEDNGLIVVGNYNTLPFDRTKWYALTTKGIRLMESGSFDSAKGQLTSGEKAIDIRRKGEPIPDIITDIITDISLDSKESNCQTSSKSDVKKCVEAWNALSKYGIKPISKLQSTSQRYQMLSARLNEYGIEDVLKAIDKIKDSSFLQGRTKVSTKWFDFEWFVRPNNFPKVLEGKYDDEKDNSPHEIKTLEEDGWQ